MTVLPPIVPAMPKAIDRRRGLPVSAAFGWLVAGWRDLWTAPGMSLVYGLGVAAILAFSVAGIVLLGWGHILFPALAGLLIVGPALATGTYEKSRRIAAGEPLSLASMLFPRRGTGSHIFFVGAILVMLVLIWLRAAVLLYALFWELRPFPGLDQIVQTLVADPYGWVLIGVGTLVGGLFAALGFAISAFSIPMLLDRRLDAFTAMGLSMTLTWHNLPVMLCWGAIVLALALLGLATGFLGFIVIFPLLGHASWHAYMAIRDEEE
jgi:uncharacterized membrane protein